VEGPERTRRFRQMEIGCTFTDLLIRSRQTTLPEGWKPTSLCESSKPTKRKKS
jgi:hypothetical protein